MMYIALVEADADSISFTIPQLPGFAADYEGQDFAAAVLTAESVLRDYIAAMIETGQTPPETRIGTFRMVDIGADALAASGEFPPVVGLRVYRQTGRTVRINITVDEGSLELIDDKAAALGLTRSAFLSAAAKEFNELRGR